MEKGMKERCVTAFVSRTLTGPECRSGTVKLLEGRSGGAGE